VPGTDRDIYLVLDDFGRLGRAWPETDEEHTDRDTLLRHLMEGQYHNPVRIVSFNPSEGWSELLVNARQTFAIGRQCDLKVWNSGPKTIVSASTASRSTNRAADHHR
jgi:hypothetical protein